MPASGSFIRGNLSGRYFSNTMYFYPLFDTSNAGSGSIRYISERLFERSTTGYVSASIGSGRRGNYGTMQGVAFGSDITSINSDSPFGTHMHVGVGKSITEGSPTSPCLELDYPGMWRFKWVILGATKTISVLAKQNSTGSAYRPSMVVVANPNIGVLYNLSASAADGAGWITIGPISVTPAGTGSVWVELHNNNVVYPSINVVGGDALRPAFFDHIITT